MVDRKLYHPKTWYPFKRKTIKDGFVYCVYYVQCTLHISLYIKSNKDQSGSIIQFEFSFFFLLWSHYTTYSRNVRNIKTLTYIMVRMDGRMFVIIWFFFIFWDGGIIHIKSLHSNQDSKHIVNGKWYLISVLFLCTVFSSPSPSSCCCFSSCI